MATADGLTQSELAEGFKGLGVQEGDVVLVHSAMRTFGRIAGGAETVVAAFLQVIGESGTLVVPTFCFYNEAVLAAGKTPLIDNDNDQTEMGSICEAVRALPNAFRSTSFRHSVAAVGRRAEVICSVDPSLCVFDMRSCFGQMLAYDTKIVMLGLNYTNCTSCHFAEYVIEVPYRHTIQVKTNVKTGHKIAGQVMTDYQPKPGDDGSYYGTRTPDFNRIGKELEDTGGLVQARLIGNAVCRGFKMRSLVDKVVEQGKLDPFCLKIPEGQDTGYSTPLDLGVVVMSPPFLDGVSAALPCTFPFQQVLYSHTLLNFAGWTRRHYPVGCQRPFQTTDASTVWWRFCRLEE